MSAYLVESGVLLSAENNLARVMLRFDCAEIVLEGKKSVGLLKVHRDKHLWAILQVQICPSMQGKGVGTWLIKNIIREAKSAKVSLTLSVLRNNPARRLYESLGFVVTGSNDYEYFMKLENSTLPH
jgi:ribosomal protein S18 acetylase RimI-like enzyme